MKNIKNTAFSLAVAAFVFGAADVYAGANQDAAIDKNSNNLTNTFGNCVRTKWQAGMDPCAPPPPPKAAPVVVPAPAPVAPPPQPPVAVLSAEQRSIYFDFNSDELTGAAADKLDALAYIIRASRGNIVRADIVGFADEMGNAKYNIALSERRAESVRAYLSQLVNIDTRVSEIRGLGESESITDCDSVRKRADRIACLAKDRRVEIELKYKHFR